MHDLRTSVFLHTVMSETKTCAESCLLLLAQSILSPATRMDAKHTVATHLLVAWAAMYAVSCISTMKLLLLVSMLSLVPMRVNSRSAGRTDAKAAGTWQPQLRHDHDQRHLASSATQGLSVATLLGFDSCAAAGCSISIVRFSGSRDNHAACHVLSCHAAVEVDLC